MFITFSFFSIIGILARWIVFLIQNKDEISFKENWKFYLGFFFLFITIGIFCLIRGIGIISI